MGNSNNNQENCQFQVIPTPLQNDNNFVNQIQDINKKRISVIKIETEKKSTPNIKPPLRIKNSPSIFQPIENIPQLAKKQQGMTNEKQNAPKGVSNLIIEQIETVQHPQLRAEQSTKKFRPNKDKII